MCGASQDSFHVQAKMTGSAKASMPSLSACFNAVQDIEGWFYREDAILFTAIHAIQADHLISGDLLEIGVYHGKSAAFLGFLRRAPERFIVCDLFGTPATSADNQAEKDDWYSGLDRQTFERRYREIHAELPDILACSSSRLKRNARLSQTFRFIHIDGSHLYRIVRQDIRLSCELLKAGGVVAIDDYRSVHTPGVAAATWEAVLQGRLRPICLTPQKMYAVAGGRKVAWFGQLKNWSETQRELKVAADTIQSRRVLRFSTS
jgi:hypothetical protein